MQKNFAQERIKEELSHLRNKIENDKQDQNAQFVMRIQEVGDYSFQVCIRGPQNTPYQNFLYFLNFQFPNEYPYIPPQVTFMNKIYHPNVNIMGYIYCGMLKNEWKSTYTIYQVLKQIKELLTQPDCQHAFFSVAAEQYLKNRDEYNKTVKEWGEKFAIYINN